MIKKDDIYKKANDFQEMLFKECELERKERVKIFFLLEQIKEVINEIL